MAMLRTHLDPQNNMHMATLTRTQRSTYGLLSELSISGCIFFLSFFGYSFFFFVLLLYSFPNKEYFPRQRQLADVSGLEQDVPLLQEIRVYLTHKVIDSSSSYSFQVCQMPGC
jgi:hypothetical protein